VIARADSERALVGLLAAVAIVLGIAVVAGAGRSHRSTRESTGVERAEPNEAPPANPHPGELEPAIAGAPTPLPKTGPGAARPADAGGIDLRGALGERRLSMPVAGLGPRSLADTYTQARAGGRVHDAIDILAPRGTPVEAVDDGVVKKLFLSVPGGITVYQFDPSSTWCYYYAHLERYAEGLHEGQELRRGDLVGYVGTTGNAPKQTPHLHLAIYRLGPDKRWWEGTPLNPYPILAGEERAAR
jgi:murein DD-endopeptidase MepM/ murein hydrolase activator NlpD